MDCLFCKIAAGEIPAKIIYRDVDAVAFMDADPKAPTHILVIPRKHIASLSQTGAPDRPLLGYLLRIAAELAKKQELDQGFRIVINTGPEGGQTIDHLHLHLLGGRPMTWPPG